jgi:hypothetical protein
MWDVNEEEADIGEVLEGHVAKSKIFCTYLLPYFLLKNTKKTKFQSSSSISKQMKFSFFHGHL